MANQAIVTRSGSKCQLHRCRSPERALRHICCRNMAHRDSGTARQGRRASMSLRRTQARHRPGGARRQNRAMFYTVASQAALQV